MDQQPTSTPDSATSHPDEPDEARWKVHGRRTMYESEWVNVYVDDVELPDATRIDHHVLTMPKASQTAVVLDSTRERVLLIWRHRFISARWGWEVPAGWVEPGENADVAIRREILEETGYEVDDLREMVEYDAIPGISSMHFTAWVAVGAHKVAEPQGIESSSIDWVPVTKVASLLASGRVKDGPSLTALSFYFASRPTG